MPNYIPFGEYLPDQPDFENPGSSNMLNVLPVTQESYGPMPSLATVGFGMAGGRIQGAYPFRDSGGNVYLFVGNDKYLQSGAANYAGGNILNYLSAAKNISAITKAAHAQVTATAHGFDGSTIGLQVMIASVTGMTQINGGPYTLVSIVDANNFTLNVDSTGFSNYVSGGTAQQQVAYTTATDGYWSFTSYGQRVIATNYTDPIQSYVVGTDTFFSNLSSGAPKARYIARVKDFTMVANTTDGSFGVQPQRVWWPALDDPTNWPTPGTAAAAQVQSDYQDLIGDGGWNQGIVGGLLGADVVIWQEKAIWRGSYVGSPVIFSFQVIENGRGTPAPGSIISAGDVAFYLGDDGFYETDGSSVVPIGLGKVDKTFWADVDTNYLYRISSVADPLNKIVYWLYPGAGSSSGVPNKILAYHYGYKRWAPLSVTAEFLLTAYSQGYTLDQLYSVLGYTFQTMPYPLDSRAWTGGRLGLAAFDKTNVFGFFTGKPLAATIDSTEENLDPNGGSINKAYVNRVWPLVDTSAAQIQLGTRSRLADPVSWSSAASMTATTGSVPVRGTGTFHRVRMSIPAGTAWSQAQGIRFDYRPAGNR